MPHEQSHKCVSRQGVCQNIIEETEVKWSIITELLIRLNRQPIFENSTRDYSSFCSNLFARNFTWQPEKQSRQSKMRFALGRRNGIHLKALPSVTGWTACVRRQFYVHVKRISILSLNDVSVWRERQGRQLEGVRKRMHLKWSSTEPLAWLLIAIRDF